MGKQAREGIHANTVEMKLWKVGWHGLHEPFCVMVRMLFFTVWLKRMYWLSPLRPCEGWAIAANRPFE